MKRGTISLNLTTIITIIAALLLILALILIFKKNILDGVFGNI